MVFCLECALRHVEKQKSCRGLKLMYRYDEVSASAGRPPAWPRIQPASRHLWPDGAWCGGKLLGGPRQGEQGQLGLPWPGEASSWGWGTGILVHAPHVSAHPPAAPPAGRSQAVCGDTWTPHCLLGAVPSPLAGADPGEERRTWPESPSCWGSRSVWDTP